MKLYSFPHISFDGVLREPCWYAAWNIRRIGRITCWCFFNDDKVFLHNKTWYTAVREFSEILPPPQSASSLFVSYCVHYFKPACFRMLFSVPGASSSFECPGTVTSPFLSACLYCRWLPRVLTIYQPARSICFTISRTFIRDSGY